MDVGLPFFKQGRSSDQLDLLFLSTIFYADMEW